MCPRIPKQIRIVIVLLVINVCLFSGNAAATVAERLNEAKQLLQQGDTDAAIQKLKALHEDHPEDPNAAYNLGDLFGKREHYDESAHYYEEALARAQQAGRPAKDIGHLHNLIAVAYYGLGRQKYYSAEVCRRILYHLANAWPYLGELGYDEQAMSDVAEITTFVLNAFAIAHRSSATKVLGDDLLTTPEAFNASIQQPELLLHPDGIDEATKLQAKETLVTYLKAFKHQHE